MSLNNKMPSVDWKTVANVHFVNLPITFKSKNQTSKYQKITEAKKIHLKTFANNYFWPRIMQTTIFDPE